MNRSVLFATFAALTLGILAAPAEAKSKHRNHHDDHDRGRWSHNHDRGYGRGYGRSRTIYVIERNRPVSRVVYVDGSGRYYRMIDGRRTYVRGRYYTSYPSRYYYQDGRPRVGVSIRF